MNGVNNVKKTSKRGKGKPFEKGNSGRPKGSKNKFTVDVKQAAFDIFKGLGGVQGAITFFKKNNQTKGQFFNLFFKMLPSNVIFDQEKPAKFIIEFNGNNSKPKPKNRKANSPS